MRISLSLPEILGSIGVFLLLVAFFLNLIGRLGHSTKSYQLMNALGAGLSCYASFLIGFAPFVVLEGTWAVVAVIALARTTMYPK